jgi:branched-chain amino acid transport system substrate-binding protein
MLMTDSPAQKATDPSLPGLSRRGFLGAGASLLGLAVGGPLLAACSSSSSGGGKGGSTKGPFQIGYVAPTTGLLASAYGPLGFSVDVAVDKINKAGGIMGRQIELVRQDDMGNAADEPKAIKALYSKNIRFVMGAIGSSQADGALAVTTPLKMLSFFWGSLKEEGDPTKYPYSFTCSPNTDQHAQVLAKLLTGPLKQTKIGLLLENSAYGAAIGPAATTLLKAAGADIVSSQSYAVTAPTLLPYVQNLKNAGATAILGAMGNPTNVLSAYDAMQQLKWYPPVASNGTDLNGVLNETSKYPAEMTNNIYDWINKSFSYEGTSGTIDPTVSSFVKEAMAAKGYTSSASLSAPFYDAMYILKQAIETAKSFDVDDVKDAIENITNYDGVGGKLSFSKTNHNGLSDDQVVAIISATGLNSKGVKGTFFQRAPGF